MTWRAVLDVKNLTMKRSDMAEMCHKLGYRFFAFNGEIYFVPVYLMSNTPSGLIAYFDTGLSVDSLKN